MDKYLDIIANLLNLNDEYEWLDFKENWFNKDEIGEYISAVANGACLCGKEYGYILWGVEDNSRNVVGTNINFDRDIDHEPYKHYLARKLKPSVAFEVIERKYENKRVILLQVPASKSVQTKFNDVAYFRIGSSKEKLSKFPEWELKLNTILQEGYPTIVNVAAPDYAQELSFGKLFMYYAAKGIALKKESFERSLKLRNKNGQYNVMAYILSDQNSIPVRVSIFSGKDKTSPLFSVKEFGNTCIMYSMDKILEYGDAINIIQADERNRISERKDVPLFDYEAFHEAILNAFIHNKWLTLNSPQISIFTDRIEILSHGGLALDQDEKGFYSGASLPVNDVLASIFLQLRISERSGRGVPKIVGRYGKEVIQIEKNRIIVTIPFDKIGVNSFVVSNKVSNKVSDKLNKTKLKMIELIRDNPNITINQFSIMLKLSEPAIKKNLKQLKESGHIQRIGSNKTGYWEVIK
ncbi:MAG: putative DNA binding domain-containing protein [Acholeplasmataceae bacterium]|nr:putative DNA binding domain-containing protein [Acholeplasmataceae bacterium]MDD4469422.1 putative DNA binding domain-containing protein [Acholeplasmataceae bacterium]